MTVAKKKVRTSITIDPEVLDSVRNLTEGSVSSYIEEALKQRIAREKKSEGQ